MEFNEQYKHPKWQKRRLDYINNQLIQYNEGNNFCEKCQSSDVQLQLHHIRYIKDKKVWEYDDNELLLLCAECHKKLHEEQEEIKLLTTEIIERFPECTIDFIMILKYISFMNPLEYDCLLEVIKSMYRFSGGFDKVRIVEKYM